MHKMVITRVGIPVIWGCPSVGAREIGETKTLTCRIGKGALHRGDGNAGTFHLKSAVRPGE